METTVLGLLERYVLDHDLRASTTTQYRRIVGIFVRESGCSALADFTADAVSKFLAAKQSAERSSYYRKSLRNTLVALLRYHGDRERVRPVKLHQLHHEAWSPAEVRSLIAAVASVFPCDRRRRRYWETLIEAAWYSGLSEVDLHRVTRRDVDRRGVVHWNRSKTGAAIVVVIPPRLFAHAEDDGPIWPLPWSGEWFRSQFAAIVRAAGLRGSFKQLRRSSGTSVERLHPGVGHRHLGNTPKVFAAHYDCTVPEPLMPEPLDGPGE